MAHSGRPLKSTIEIDNLRSDISSERYDTVKKVLAKVGINASDRDGRTPLINAIIEKKTDKGNRIVHQVGRPSLDAHKFPFFKSYEDFVVYTNIAY